MRTKLLVLIAIALCAQLATVHAAGKELDKSQKEKLTAILAGLKVKGAEAKPARHQVSIPVASAGSRGAMVRTGNRFAVLWPVEHISPLTAFSENLLAKLALGGADLKEQLIDFLESYPEFGDEQLLTDLRSVLEKLQ